VNGDGFGVAWYSPETVQLGSCVYKFMTPLWSNSNLKNMGCHIKAPLILGHARAASTGANIFETVAVNYENCHPFKFGRYTFMHNGNIPQFSKVKRILSAIISEEIFREIMGSTDSEHIFALIMHMLPKRSDAFVSPEELAATLEDAVSLILNILKAKGIHDGCSLNLVLTDGYNVVASRFRSDDSEAPSLYYYGSKDGRMRHPSNTWLASPSADLSICSPGSDCGESWASRCRAFVVASEPQWRDDVAFHKAGGELAPVEASDVCTQEDSGSPREISRAVLDSKWHLIPKNHILICSGSSLDLSRCQDIIVRPMQVSACKKPLMTCRSTEFLVNFLKTDDSEREGAIKTTVSGIEPLIRLLSGVNLKQACDAFGRERSGSSSSYPESLDEDIEYIEDKEAKGGNRVISCPRNRSLEEVADFDMHIGAPDIF
jgi:predicted glutamine amidotransferase